PFMFQYPPQPRRTVAHPSIPAPFQAVTFASRGLLRQSVASRGNLLPSVALCGLANSFAIAALWCYMYTPCRRKSMENRYRRSLEKLAAEPPTTKTALVCALLPEIEIALASGKTPKEVSQRLADEGLDVTYKTFREIIRRVRRKARTTTARRRETSTRSNAGDRFRVRDPQYDT